MKKTLLNILCGILCAALLISAVCVGAVRGWRGERAATLANAFADGSGLAARLEERAMDAANLMVVVSRHLDATDARLMRLKDIYATLTGPISEVEDLVQVDSDLSDLARELGQSLPELDSVRASARDQAYLSSLTRTLSEPSAVAEHFADLARGFNNRLINSPTGWIAQRFGVTIIPVP